MAIDNPMPAQISLRLFRAGQPPRGLYRFFPPATRTEFWAGSILVALALLGTAWVTKCRCEALALEQESVNIEGKVVRRWTTQERRRVRYRVEYEYPASGEVDGRVFRDWTELPEEYFKRLQDGGPISVTVCRTDPGNHQVTGEAPRVFSSSAAMYFCLGVLAVLALAGVLNLAWWWISYGKPGPAQDFFWPRLRESNRRNQPTNSALRAKPRSTWSTN
jgi:hypothetical protein